MKRGRKRKAGDRYTTGKSEGRLKPQPKPAKGPLLDYELAAARQHLAERVTDPMWQTRAGWHNLTGRLPDYLTSTAHNFRNLFGLWRRYFVPKNTHPPMPRRRSTGEGGRVWVATDNGGAAELPDAPSTWRKEVAALMDQIKRELFPWEFKAVRRLTIEDRRPDNDKEWKFLEDGLRKIYRILNAAEPKSKRTIINERRSEFAKDVTQMLEVRHMNDAERFVIAYASANCVSLVSAGKRGAKLAVQRMRERYSDFDKYLPAIVQLFNDGVVERTGNRHVDYDRAYRQAKLESKQQHRKTGTE